MMYEVNKNQMMPVIRHHSLACAAENRAEGQGDVAKLLSVNQDHRASKSSEAPLPHPEGHVRP